MTELKSFQQVLKEHKKDAPITAVLIMIVFSLAMWKITDLKWFEQIILAAAFTTILMVVMLWFQRYT